MNRTTASIIIRAKDEGRWLPRCLQMIHKQTFRDLEIILVDNESSDDTVAVAQHFGVDKVAPIKDYTPGRALNLGAGLASGRYLVFISAHCVPYDENWLENLITGFSMNPSICGVYGRQVPLPESQENNARDLLSVFRTESRIQKIDNFFHNANSAITFSSWEKNPFDEALKNLEDQDWAKRALESGGEIFYHANALVYHNDGLHFHESQTRTAGVAKLLRNLSEIDLEQLPSYAKDGYKSWSSVTLFDDKSNSHIFNECLRNYVNFVRNISGLIDGKHMLVSSRKFMESLSGELKQYEIDKINFLNRDESTLDLSPETDIMIILSVLNDFNGKTLSAMPEAYFFYNPQYVSPSKNSIFNIIKQFYSADLDLVSQGRRIQELAWIRNSEGEFKSIEKSLLPGKKRDDVYEVFLGAGTAISRYAISMKVSLANMKTQIIETDNVNRRTA